MSDSSAVGMVQLSHLERLCALPPNGSLHGVSLDQHLLLNLWIILALAGVAHALALTGLVLSRDVRSRNESTLRTLRLEYLPLAAFTLLLAWLALRAERLWAESRYTGAEPTALQVEVTGMQFAWYFRYPGHDGTFGRVHSEMVDAGAGNPGQTVHLHFTPSIPGTYAVLCTQLCGLGHYRMNANLRVLPAPDFERWLHARERQGTP